MPYFTQKAPTKTRAPHPPRPSLEKKGEGPRFLRQYLPYAHKVGALFAETEAEHPVTLFLKRFGGVGAFPQKAPIKTRAPHEKNTRGNTCKTLNNNI